MSETITTEMRKEADLHHEAENAEQTAKWIASEKSLRGKVVVPKVEWALTGKSVMTAEFMKGCQLTDVPRLEGMGLGKKEVMDLCCDLYGAMTFKWGWVHCDPRKWLIWLVYSHGCNRLMIRYISQTPAMSSSGATLPTPVTRKSS